MNGGQYEERKKQKQAKENKKQAPMKKLERKAQMRKEAAMKGGAKA